MSAYLQSKSDNLPKVTQRRLIELESVLKAWQKTKITSADISALTGWKDSLIRHDFWLAGLGGDGVSNGYVTADLLEAGGKMGIKQRRCKDIISEIVVAVAEFPVIAEQVGIKEKTCEYINSVIKSMR